MTECSGLAIISTYPMKEVEFHQFTLKGTIWDGEALQGKGVGRVRIEPRPRGISILGEVRNVEI